MSEKVHTSTPGERYCPTCEQTYPVGERCPADGTRLVLLRAQVDALLGRDLDGRYSIIEKLGAGAMGAVYRGSQHSVGREVAIKVVTPALTSEPMVVKRFLREAKLAGKLSNPHAVNVVDFGQTEDGLFYLVMDLVRGRTLDEARKRERTFSPERAIRIASQILDALEGAHQLGIVHRDLKPSNVMLLDTGRDLVKVLDFGLAKSLSQDSAATTMTNAGSLLGTPAYMPPEIATGHDSDSRADLYSLGCMLYEMLSDRLPFEADSMAEMVSKHATEVPAPLPEAPPAIAAVVMRLLAKDPLRRYQSASATREALEQALRRPEPLPEDTHPSLGPFPIESLAAPSSSGRVRRVGSATESARVGALATLSGAEHDEPVAPRRGRGWLIGGVLLGVAGALAVVAVLKLGGAPARPPTTNLPPTPVEVGSAAALPTVVPASGSAAPIVAPDPVTAHVVAPVEPPATIDAGVEATPTVAPDSGDRLRVIKSGGGKSGGGKSGGGKVDSGKVDSGKVDSGKVDSGKVRRPDPGKDPHHGGGVPADEKPPF